MEEQEGTFCQYRENQAEIMIKGNSCLCPLSFFLKDDLPYTARNLLPGCPLSVYMEGGNIRAIRVFNRQIAPQRVSFGMHSLPIQDNHHANAANGIITTPEAMKSAYDRSFTEKIFSNRVFPIWILSELMGGSKDIINNLEEVERKFEGFRRMNTKENAFFLGVSVALVQRLLLRSTPMQTRQSYFKGFEQASLNDFTEPGLRTLSTLTENKILWANLTSLIQSCVITHINSELAEFLCPEDRDLKEASEILIRGTAETLGVNLAVYSPRDIHSKLVWEIQSDSLHIALIKDSGFYYPLLTREELIEEGYDVYTCSFIENPVHNQSV